MAVIVTHHERTQIKIVGKRNLLVDGIVASIDKALFSIMERRDAVSDYLGDEVCYIGPSIFFVIIDSEVSEEGRVRDEIYRLREAAPSCRMICLLVRTDYDNDQLINSGANGVLRGNISSSELNLILKLALSECGQFAYSFSSFGSSDQSRPVNTAERRVVEVKPLWEGATDRGVDAMPGYKLSPRERAVLSGMAVGESNKAIARRLLISDATVKAHARTLFRKVGVHSRTQAIHRLREQCPKDVSFREWLLQGSGTEAASLG